MWKCGVHIFFGDIVHFGFELEVIIAYNIIALYSSRVVLAKPLN